MDLKSTIKEYENSALVFIDKYLNETIILDHPYNKADLITQFNAVFDKWIDDKGIELIALLSNENDKEEFQKHSSNIYKNLDKYFKNELDLRISNHEDNQGNPIVWL